MRIAILGAVVLLLLAGGGAGAYFYFMQPAEASVGSTEEHKEAKADEGHHGDSGGHGSGHAYVEIDPLVLPIIDNNGVSQVVNIVIMIEVDSERKRSVVNGLEPRLKDAFIQDLYGVFNRHAVIKGGVLQVNMIKERLHKISLRVLGDDVVEDVLLQVVQQRPI